MNDLAFQGRDVNCESDPHTAQPIDVNDHVSFEAEDSTELENVKQTEVFRNRGRINACSQ